MGIVGCATAVLSSGRSPFPRDASVLENGYPGRGVEMAGGVDRLSHAPGNGPTHWGSGDWTAFRLRIRH
jgi:hypothetical protein